jgi:hypothetical protein
MLAFQKNPHPPILNQIVPNAIPGHKANAHLKSRRGFNQSAQRLPSSRSFLGPIISFFIYAKSVKPSKRSISHAPARIPPSHPPLRRAPHPKLAKKTEDNHK